MQVLLPKHEEVIKTFSLDALHPPFRKRIQVGTQRRDFPKLDAPRFENRTELAREPAIPIANDVRWLVLPLLLEEHAEVTKELWGGEFWEDGYFARTVGDKVTAEVIRRYIKYHREHEKNPKQLKLF